MTKLFRNVLTIIATLLLAGTSAKAQVDFSHFHTPAEVDRILQKFVQDHPNLASVRSIGKSVENRDINALRISGTPQTGFPKAHVVFVGLHHAEEWITVEMGLFLADQILSRYATDPALKADVDASEIWIIPILNPDGFEFTQTGAQSLSNRLWRKNRRPNPDGTFGVDLNRNYSYEWGLDSGSSGATWNPMYRGAAPFSEPETSALRDFLSGLNDVKVFVTYHSYTELFLRTWSYTTDDPPGELILKAISDRSINQIKNVHGEDYGDSLYLCSGEATDYLWGTWRSAAFTTELRPKTAPASPAGSGFYPPPSEIVPSSEENLPVALALLHDAAAREVWIRDYIGDTGKEPSAVFSNGQWSHDFTQSPDITTVPTEFFEGDTITVNVIVINSSTVHPVQDVHVVTFYATPSDTPEFPKVSDTKIDDRTITVPPSGTSFSFYWTVPKGALDCYSYEVGPSWTIATVIMHDTDMPLSTYPWRSSNIAMHDFYCPAKPNNAPWVKVHNFLHHPAWFEWLYDTGKLPPAWQVDPPEWGAIVKGTSEATLRKARLLGVTGPVLEPGQTIQIPLHVRAPAGAHEKSIEFSIHTALVPLTAGKPEAIGKTVTVKLQAAGR